VDSLSCENDASPYWPNLHTHTYSFPKTAGAIIEGNDLSLFYGDETELTTITDRRTFLSPDVYGPLVRDTVVCCVDILLVRYCHATARRECLLVERRSEPAKGLWWLPGGRLLKGETFFAAARRKAWQETGVSDVQPIQVLGVWNTFFPKSSWDTADSKGTQTVNPIVLVEMQSAKPGATPDIKLDEQSENYRWIGLDPAAAAAAGEDKYVLEALFRLEAWNPHYMHRKI
jgi:colanic acid biosynthesis protein WcaH